MTVGAIYDEEAKYKVNKTSKADLDSPGCGGVEFKITFYKVTDEAINKVNVCVDNGFNTPSVVGATEFRCEANSIFFTVRTDADSYDIEFNDLVGTGFFDRISLETV